MTKKAWLIFGVICVLLIGGLIFISRQNRIDVSNVDINAVQGPSKANGYIGDHTYGNMKSKVTLIEYGDFQCPGCGAAYPVLKEVVQKYQNQIGFIFRNYPLTTLHPNAFAAASVAEVAGLHGKFWEMHDALYESQDSWSSLSGTDRTLFFTQKLTNIGLNGDKLISDANNANVHQKISFDKALGSKAGVTGTPTLFVNGKKVSDLRFADGKSYESTDPNDTNPYIWSDATAFAKYAINPALKANGIDLPK